MVLELCSLGDFFDLFKLHKQNITSNKSLKKHLFVQILKGIHSLHTVTGHAHLDLKLENLLVGENNQLKITDLGMAAPHQMPQTER